MQVSFGVAGNHPESWTVPGATLGLLRLCGRILSLMRDFNAIFTNAAGTWQVLVS